MSTKIEIDGHKWADGYRDGWMGLRQLPEDWSYSSGWIEGDGDRRNKKPRERFQHHLDEEKLRGRERHHRRIYLQQDIRGAANALRRVHSANIEPDHVTRLISEIEDLLAQV